MDEPFPATHHAVGRPGTNSSQSLSNRSSHHQSVEIIEDDGFQSSSTELRQRPESRVADRRSLPARITELVTAIAPLSLVAFGGPPAHIALIHNIFVVEKKWLDDALFSELFAVTQALPGPGSTEMLFSIAIHRGGLIPAIFAFISWSLPGLLLMMGLGLGVSKLPQPLPQWLVQLQNGIAAAAVGLVAQAAVALSRKIVYDRSTLFICTIAACAAVLYSSSWLEPVLVAWGGVAGFALLHIAKAYNSRFGNKPKDPTLVLQDSQEQVAITESNGELKTNEEATQPVDDPSKGHVPMSVRTGLIVFAVVIGLLVACIVLKKTVSESRALAVLMQFYVAGCIIFGGGPVVIPLLYAYVVVPGWVEPQDFLVGVALVQAMPGPNFNFAAYCGAIALSINGPAASVGGALLGYLALFSPGLALNAAAIPLWHRIRHNRWLLQCLPGINAAAIGLVFSASYLLWQKGIIRGDSMIPIGDSAYHAVIAGCSFVLVNAGMRTPLVMFLGILAGLVGWGLKV
ncbi:chromate ion transporter [Phlyctochytrium arcticum]|nr:chromate ion transporter [Phlyctochytrium arcticum]